MVFAVASTHAQGPGLAFFKRDSVRHLKAWHVVSPIALADSIPVDTAHVNFQDVNAIDRYSIANSYNGNLGSPLQSKLYFDRPFNSPFIFADAYDPYVRRPDNVTFYNTKGPYSRLEYLGGIAVNYRDEDNVRFLFTANANKRLNFGLELDYTRAIGEYENQSTKRLSGDLFASYDGRRYSASGAFMFNKMDNYENGGLANPDDLHGDNLNDPQVLPTRLQGPGYSGYSYNAFVYNHSYSLGFERKVQVSEDSVRVDFVPVTRFAHTLKLAEQRKRYLEPTADTAFYANTYFSPTTTRDTAALQTISNTVSVSIEEEFNKWMQFGLTAYLTNDIERYTMMSDSATLQRTNRSRTKVGGVLSKQRGTHIKYNINAELDVLGAQAGDFRLTGDLSGFFRLWRDSVAITARGAMSNESPSFFQEQYSSNHFRWHNDFNRTYRTQVGGTLAIPTKRTRLDVTFENVSNLIYYDRNALPQQFDGSTQVLAVNLKQDFRFWRFFLENNVVYQFTSRPEILPLPTITLYHNFYYLDQWFKVLDVQFGIDLRYHTAYYAPDYMPATGQFFVQDEVRIGNYPVMNLYLNFHLKQVRFFVKWYHFNQSFMEGDYYSMPRYPINPNTFRMGISWNFYN